MDDDVVILVEDVSKTYPVRGAPAFQALRDIQLSIAKGEIFGIIGRSGAGKSTLLRVLNLLERPTTGRVHIDGHDITALDDAGLRRQRQRIGMVFQHFNLLNARTVYENVRFPLRVAGDLNARQMRERVRDVLNVVGLADQIDKYPRQLSGGQRQRVGIARALANHPHVLLCDEATSALDPETTQSILSLLGDINRTLGLTIVLITHSMDVIRAVSDRVAILDHGQLVESGPVIDVFLHPKHPTTRALLAESGIDTGTQPFPTAPGSTLLRLTSQGDAATQPALSRISRTLGLDLTLVGGSVGRIKNTPYSQLTVDVGAVSPEQLASLQAELAAHGIHQEAVA